MYRVIFYKSQRGDSPVDDFLDSLQIKVRAKVIKWLRKLQELGPDLPRPFIVVTHGFFKKTQGVPEQEIERAIRMMNDFILRRGG